MADELRPDIAAARDQMLSKVGVGKAIRNLVTHLQGGESVWRLASGNYGGRLGLIALTDRRLLFVADGAFSQRVEDFPLGRISSVEYTSGFASGTLVVYASGNKAEVKSVPKEDGKALADQVRAALSAPAPVASPTAPQSAPSGGSDVIEQLERLSALHSAGHISAEEFAAAKAKVLG